MFFGNMQSFYRRNSVHNQSPSKSPKAKEQNKRVKHSDKYKDEDGGDNRTNNNTSVRRASFSLSRSTEYDQPAENHNRTNIPVIRIGMYEPETSKKSFNILKEKERALRYNASPAMNDNSERLGPNKNNIIEETLEIERRKSADWRG